MCMRTQEEFLIFNSVYKLFCCFGGGEEKAATMEITNAFFKVLICCCCPESSFGRNFHACHGLHDHVTSGYLLGPGWPVTGRQKMQL